MGEYNLAIIGNGYDLHYGQPTSYDKFYNTLKDINELTYEKFSYKYINTEKKHLYNYYKQVKGRKNNYFYLYFLSYNKIFNTWNSFENELLNILKQFDCLLLEMKENINNCIISNNSISYKLKNIYDILKIVKKCSFYNFRISNVNSCEYIDIDFNYLKNDKMYIKGKIDNYIESFPKKLYEELEEFSNFFISYLKSFVCEPNRQKFIEDNNINHYLIYNYTNLIKGKNIKSKCYINGSIDKNNIIFGVDSQFDDLERFNIFFKRTQRVTKKTNIPSNILRDQCKKIVIFGHSLNEADDDSLKLFLNPNIEYDAIHVYYYEKEKFSSANLSQNLIRILGKQYFDILYNSEKLKFMPMDNY